MKLLAGIALIIGIALAFLTTPTYSKTIASEKSTFTLEFSEHFCSGTAVSANVILSAAHCFLTDEAITFKIDGREAKVTKIIRDGKDHVLVMVNIQFANKAKITNTAMIVGERIYYFGNPGIKDIYREGYVAGSEDGAMILDVNSWQGDSGAGVFNDKGEIVGVINALAKNDIFKLTFCYPLQFTQEQYKSFGVI
jgi:V8-like Glu-specific endopeptidase